ncbi:hypothetical protein G6F21_014529 [Rhizopus arrhizus]|nr:hypothetical protein G6F21_014529 [Rhizopus arrhizus]
MQDFGLTYRPEDAAMLTGSISAMPPFPEVVDTLAALKQAGFRLCIISNTDDQIIAGNGPTSPPARSSPMPTTAWA